MLIDEYAGRQSLTRRPKADRTPAHRIAEAPRSAATRLATALAAAFYEDPVFRWLSPDDRRRAAMLAGFFDVFVDAFIHHGEAYTDAHLGGTALWAAPQTDPLLAGPSYMERIEEIAGPDAPRMLEIVERFEEHAPKEPYYHLQFLGVLPERQGAGLGGALVWPILARCDRHGVPAYLEATSDRNRAMFERHGFRAHGSIPLSGGPAPWRMWRDPVG